MVCSTFKVASLFSPVGVVVSIQSSVIENEKLAIDNNPEQNSSVIQNEELVINNNPTEANTEENSSVIQNEELVINNNPTEANTEENASVIQNDELDIDNNPIEGNTQQDNHNNTNDSIPHVDMSELDDLYHTPDTRLLNKNWEQAKTLLEQDRALLRYVVANQNGTLQRLIQSWGIVDVLKLAVSFRTNQILMACVRNGLFDNADAFFNEPFIGPVYREWG